MKLMTRTETPVWVEYQEESGNWYRLQQPLLPSEVAEWMSPGTTSIRVSQVGTCGSMIEVRPVCTYRVSRPLPLRQVAAGILLALASFVGGVR